MSKNLIKPDTGEKTTTTVGYIKCQIDKNKALKRHRPLIKINSI